MPQYGLHYMDSRGLCEPLRLCLHYAGIPFEDIRYSAPEFAKFKELYPGITVPALFVDGKMLTQSGSILRYIGRFTGLNGKDSWEEAKADETCQFSHDYILAHLKYLLHRAGIKPIESAEEIDVAYAEFIPPATKALEFFAKMLEGTGNGYVLKSGITYADFFVQNYVTTLRKLDDKLVAKYPIVVEHFEKIQKLPQIKDYMANRKETVN
ncbi:unnamed protein product [Bursaphelenchus xylophilus]|uniref:(pine wood nematode) hypothetical protein n=1 Tax=Bursaphelenchus xylophilus TaxID=6326 RepID=A0A1I7RYX4_BURXY|nr:unnamed protein product [Bursaphelenchus xylophilus]CAG9092076.1 unnamed protein product [Bursaphelenchus xylophilus]